jgi:peptide chain release factor subunit 1
LVGHEVVDRLIRFRSADAPVLTVYLAIPTDPGELPGVEARLHSLLKPVREMAESHELPHAQRESLRADVNRVLSITTRAREVQGRSVALFACQQAGLLEEVDLPRRVRDQAVADAAPYLRPLLAVLEEAHRYSIVVLDRARAWLFEFYMGKLEEETKSSDPLSSKRRTPHRAEQQARHHFRETAERAEEFIQTTGAELLIIGGHKETVAEFRPFLPYRLQSRVAGTFVIDPHTMTPARVREQTEQIVQDYERDEEERLVNDALERVAARALGAAGLEWCLMAVNERAVQVLLVDDDEEVPGRVSDTCGWLGMEEEDCPVCGERTRKTPDVVDEMAVAVIDASGQVKHVQPDTALSRYVVAAHLRFPVPAPSPSIRPE